MSSKNPKKPGMSAAFKEKAKKEKDKLQKTILANQLNADMLRMTEEGQFSDVTLTCGVDRYAVHSPLIHARLPDLYALCANIGDPKNGTEEHHHEFDLGKLGISPELAKELIQLLYISDNVKSHWHDIKNVSTNKSLPNQQEKTNNAEEQKGCQSSNSSLEPQEGCQSSKPNSELQEGCQSSKPTSELQECCQSTESSKPTTALQEGCQSSNSASELQECGQSSKPNSELQEGCQSSKPNSKLQEGCQSSKPTSKLQEGCQSSNSASELHTNPPVENNDINAKEVLEEEENKQSDSIRWRKTDPTLNEPSMCDSEHLQNGDIKREPINLNDRDSENGLLKLFPAVNNLPEAASSLGRDLLRMLVSGYGHDVTINVEDKQIPAHKFMLCSRSNYFEAMLGGSWIESNSAEINLEGEVVYLADMYCLEGLKEACAFNLRKDYCHFFHKPCNGCLTGVTEAIMLSYAYRMTELYESSVRWVLKYLDRSWSQRNFAAMPSEVIHQCSEFAVTELSQETAVPMTIQVDKLVQSLPRVKWSAPVHKEAQWLLDACIQYIAINFYSIVEQQNFEMLLVGLGWNKGLLETLFDRIVPSLSEDKAIPVYIAVSKLWQKATQDEERDWNQDALELVHQLLQMCHSYMVKNVNYFARTQGWNRIPGELQQKIKDDAVFVDDDKKVLAPRPVLSSSQKPRLSSARGASTNTTRSSTTSASNRPSSSASQRPTSAAGQRQGSRQVRGAKSGTKWKP